MHAHKHIPACSSTHDMHTHARTANTYNMHTGSVQLREHGHLLLHWGAGCFLCIVLTSTLLAAVNIFVAIIYWIIYYLFKASVH